MSTETKYTSALCILHGVTQIIKVEVLKKENVSLKTHRVRLKRDDITTVREQHLKLLRQKTNDVIVPEICLISPVTWDNHPSDALPDEREICGEIYFPVILENVKQTDILIWAPNLHLGRTELILCTVYFTGFSGQNPSKIWGFICPQQYFHESKLVPGETKLAGKTQGWGKIFKVPLTELYRPEDVNKARQQVATELLFDKLEMRCNSNPDKKLHEFVYTPAQQIQDESSWNGLYPDLRESLDSEDDDDDDSSGLAADLITLEQDLDNDYDVEDHFPSSSFNARERSREKVIDPQVKNEAAKLPIQIRTMEGKTYRIDANPDWNVQNLKQEFAKLHGGHWEMCSLFHKTRKLQDNKSLLSYQIAPGDFVMANYKSGGAPSKPVDPIQIHDKKVHVAGNSSKINENKEDSLRTERNRDAEVPKIILFGKCFSEEGVKNKVFLNNLQIGDIVMARPNNDVDIMGRVNTICEIPVLNTDQIFAGVEFEDILGQDPFEIRHVWGDECDQRCMQSKFVYVPSEILFNNDDQPKKHMRLLKDNFKAKKAKAYLPIPQLKPEFPNETGRHSFLQHCLLDYNTLNPGILAKMGIEGNVNSSYIDAVIFALFAFTNNFDEGLNHKQLFSKSQDPAKQKIDLVLNLLLNDIVTPIRNANLVKWEQIQKMRRLFSEILNDKSYLGDPMDAETFIVNLFSKVLQVPEFFVIDDDIKDYVFQVFPPVDAVKRPSVQFLLDEYCAWADIKFREVPQKGFLIKLPVSGGVRQFKEIYPDLELNLDKILQKQDGNRTSMVLRSVICLQKNHFTCFVRTKSRMDDGSEKWIWLFHDSRATEEEKSILTLCEGLEEGLEILASCSGSTTGNFDVSLLKLEPKMRKWVKIIMSTAYICVYEPIWRSWLFNQCPTQ